MGSAEPDAEATPGLPEDPVAKAELETLRLELDATLEELRQVREQAQDQQLRAVAEMDNLRKRSQRDVENAHRYGLEKAAQELLPVIDSLELAGASAENSDASSLLAGQQATLKLLAKAFERFSIQPIEPVGAPFDPNLHEAIVVQESATAAPNSVLQVVQRGYSLNGRLLRPARVIVAKDPAQT
ncbi:MAG: nucleotide exchange factor GrpE [Steroidobacteraceae bacterium]